MSTILKNFKSFFQNYFQLISAKYLTANKYDSRSRASKLFRLLIERDFTFETINTNNQFKFWFL